MSGLTNDAPTPGQLIQDAFARGQTALSAGALPEALRWFGRAHRLAPDDLTIALTLASISIAADASAAIGLFRRVLRGADIREAWMGLATALRQSARIQEAREALAECLSRHAPHPGMTGLADQIARESGAPGWCGLSGTGMLTVRPIADTSGRKRAYVYIDGVRTRPGQMPPDWARARTITVRIGGEHLLGSPISPRAIGMVEGYVDVWDAGLRGWAWQPGDPDVEPELTVLSGGAVAKVVARQPASGIPGLAPLARPRSFAIASSPLPGGGAPVQVLGHDGRDLLGSPVPWIIEPGTARRAGPGRTTPLRGNLTVLIQPNPAATSVSPCLTRVLASIEHGTRVIVLGRTEPEAARAAQDQAGSSVIWLEGEIGPGLVPAQGDDVVILDSLAVVPDGWWQRLSHAAYAAPDIGTVSAFSNRGVAPYPIRDGVSLAWFGDDEARTVAELDGLAAQANDRDAVDLPYGGKPCLFIRGDCLAATGKVRSAAFAQGEGALEDFCSRASAMGWRHVALTGLFVGCRDQDPPAGDPASSDAAIDALRRRNQALLARLHPGRYDRTAVFRAADPLGPARRRMDLARWAGVPRADSLVIVTHDDGGGVGRRVDAMVADWRGDGRPVIVLRPEKLANGLTGVRVDDGDKHSFPNLVFAMPAEQRALARLLRDAAPVRAALHHFLNHDPATIETVLALGIPYEAHTHDFAWFCPRIALIGPGDRYCAEPDLDGCEACVAETGTYLHEPIGVRDLVARSELILAGAERVVAPSEDASARMERHFPAVAVLPEPHEDDTAIAEPPPIPVVRGTVRICVAGAIGLHKGYFVLLACARDARERDLDLTFLVAGTTIDDASLIETGRVFVTGRYDAHEAVDLIRSQDAALAFLPSICPETWCLGLTELWRAGLRVAAFDIGAPAERIRRTGRGFLLPAELPPDQINDALISAARDGRPPRS